jgi:hypothetical protein
MTYIRASELGCALDCDLRNGRNKHTGGEATDDGPRINAAMAPASADHPITLIIDGSALISGLFLPAGGYWSIAGLGCGTGFFVKSGTNNDGIHNGPPSAGDPQDPGPPAPVRGMNVSLNDFTLNGNHGNGRNGNSATGRPRGTVTKWFFGVNLMNIDNITIKNVVVVNSPAYHFRLSNVGNVQISGCVMQSSGENTDGIHFNGPANDITISGCDFTTSDDSIALNCPEGYSGNISRVAVTNCTFNSPSLMRLYTSDGNRRCNIDTVSVRNCSGTLWEGAFFIGWTTGTHPNAVASLTISDCNLATPAALAITESFGSIALTNVTFVPSLSHVGWDPSEPNHTPAFFRPPPAYAGVTLVGSSLSIENCTILRKSNMDVAGLILENNSVIKNLTFNGFAVQDEGSYSSVHELLNLEAGSIGQLVINTLDSKNIEAPVSSGGFASIGSVAGSGVLATAWQFPDSVMTNNVPYISANSGKPSIKINGVVEPYPQS